MAWRKPEMAWPIIRHAVSRTFCAKILTWYLYVCTKCWFKSKRKIRNQIKYGEQILIEFGRLFKSSSRVEISLLFIELKE